MSAATRRNGNSSTVRSDSSGSSSSSPERPRSISLSRPSPYILLIYPIILALGSLFAIISPSAYTSTYSAPLTPGIASEINTPKTPQALNYFAGKQNILNLYFVKIGWFWTTLAFILLQLTNNTTISDLTQKQPPSSRANPNTKNPLVQAFLRYSLITLSWILTTQWFFGPALIDRSFTSTGGRCVPRTTFTPNTNPLSEAPLADIDLSSVATNLSCKAAGGKWLGGHDVSGHFFMLVLSSAFLFLEFFISEAQYNYNTQSTHPHISPSAAAHIAKEATEEEKRAVGGWESEEVAKVRLWTRYFVWAVILLDAWMLLMTAIWFHTLFEKMSGLALAAGSIWGVYFLPRFFETWRMVVGGV
jgi:Inositol phospholipid synthesis and fat-storage-inducing TM